jgi:hypothetical protein
MPLPKGFQMDAPAKLPSGFVLDSDQSAPPAPRQTINPEARTATNYGSEVVRGVGRGLKNDAVGLYQSARHPAETGRDMFNQAFLDIAATKGAWDASKGQPLSARAAGAGLAALENAPVIGGMVQHAEQGGGRMGSPEAVGAAAEGVTSIEAPEVAAKAIELAPRVPEMARSVAQTAIGVGPKLTEETAEKAAADFEKKKADVAERNANKMDEARQKQADAQVKADTENRAERLRLKQEYEQKVRDANEKHARDKAKAEEANAQALRDYNQAIGKVVEKNRAIEEARKASADTQARTQVQGSQLIYGLNGLAQTLRQRANGMFDAVRDKVGNATEPGQDLGAATRQALQKIAGSTERPKVFKDILSKYPEAEPDTIEYQGAQIQKGTPLYDVLKQHGAAEVPTVSFGDLQGYYSELGSELSRGNLPADVYLATKALQESVGNLMQRMANKAGAGKDLIAARQFYRDYMDTFHSPQGPSGSGSPVAQALDAKDPMRAVDYFAGKSGDRGIAMLRKYDPDLANLAQEAQRTQRGKAPAPRAEKGSISAVKPPKRQAAPSGANLPLPPVLPEGETVPFQQPKLEPAPKAPMLDPEALKRQEVTRAARSIQKFSKGDLYILLSGPIGGLIGGLLAKDPGMGLFYGAVADPALFMGRKLFARALDMDAVKNWLENPDERDFKAMEKLPPESQAQVRDALQQFINRQPRGISVSPKVRAFLLGGALAGQGKLAPRSSPSSSPGGQGAGPGQPSQLPAPRALAGPYGNPTDNWSNPQQ